MKLKKDKSLTNKMAHLVMNYFYIFLFVFLSVKPQKTLIFIQRNLNFLYAIYDKRLLLMDVVILVNFFIQLSLQ